MTERSTGTKRSERSSVRILLQAAAVFGLGLLAGILLQKYYPVGSLLRGVGIPYNVPASTPTPDPLAGRTEVPYTVLSPGRVMVAVVFGQSNSANWGESRGAAVGRVFNYYQGKLYLAQDPLLGAAGSLGSVWTRLGDRIIAEGLYDVVVFVPLGQATAGISRWAPGGDLHPRILAAIDELRGKQLPVTHLLWHQGEQDAYLQTSKAAYQASFREMLSGIREQGVTAPIYVSVATRCGMERGYSEIQQAQAELVDRAQGIYPGPNTDLLGFAYRYDGCHFSHEGLEEAAGLWLQALRSSDE